MAVAPIDEDDDENVLKQLDAPVANIPDVETAKLRIIALSEDQQRKIDYQNRLERKLLALDTALAQQRDEVESLQRTLDLEMKKDAADASSRQIERAQKTAKQEDRIRNALSDVLYRKAPPSARKKKKDQVFELDTVLISFIRPNDNIRYNLPFRVDNTTTLKHLRDDACKYWDVSTEDFILKTMGNSKCQNEIMVKDCFKQGEIAQLRLEFKNKEQTSVSEAEYKAIAPKNKKGRSRSNKDKADMGADSVLKFNDRFYSTLKKLGGIYFLLKLRDLKPSEHVSKIKPRDCFIYLLLAVLTMVLYSLQRPPGEQFWLMRGIERSFYVSVPKPEFDPTTDTTAFVPSFKDLKHYEDVWDWLQITLPYILWRNSSFTDQSVATYNALKGYVNIRQKTLKEPSPAHQHCEKFKDTVDSLTGASCPSIGMSTDEELTSNTFYEGLKRYWEYHLQQDKSIDFIRGPALPWKFVSAEDNHKLHNIGTINGNLQAYDPGGYSVEYRAALPKVGRNASLNFYKKDMREFRQKQWINRLTTRAVFISLSIYNYHYDMWTAIEMAIEMPPSGLVIPSFAIKPFTPNLFETASEYLVTYVLFFRLLIGGYIFFVVGMNERAHKTRNQKAGFRYHTSLNGVCDMCITITILATIILRFVRFNSDKTTNIIARMDDKGNRTTANGYVSHFDLASDYEWLFLLEGFMFTFTMFRLISLFRINRTVYLLWHTTGKAVLQGLYLCLLFIPTLLFFTVCAHRIWGAKLEEFQTMAMSYISVYHMTKGAGDTNALVEVDALMSMGFYLTLYILVTFLLTTGFAIIFIESYYVVQLTSPSQGEKFTYEKWKNWLIHPVILSLFHFAVQGSPAPSDTAGD